MSKYTEAFGRELYETRANKGLSMRAAASASGLNTTTLMNAEQGKNVNMSTYEALAEAYEVPFERIMRSVLKRLKSSA